MIEHAVITLADTTIIKRQFAARLNRLVVVMNAEKVLYESVHGSGEFNRFAPLGLAAPDAAITLSLGAAGNVNGTRAYLVVYFDSNNNVMSNPRDPDNPVAIAATNDIVRVTFHDNPTHPLITHRRIYRNESDGGTSFGLIATIAVTEPYYDDNATDATVRGAIAAGNSVQLDNDVPEAGEYDYCISHKNYVFLLGKQFFTFSKPGNAMSYPLRNKTPIENGQGGRIRLSSPVGDILVYYKDSTVYEHHFDSLPHGLTGDGFGKTMTIERGCLNESALVNVRGTQYVMDRWGIYQSRGGTSEQDVGTAVEGLWQGINWEQAHKFSAVHDDKAAYWFVAMNGETECRNVFVLNIRSLRAGSIPRWHLHRLPVGVRHATRFRMVGDTPALYGMQWSSVAAFITPSGHTGYLCAGYRDMVDPELTGEGEITTQVSTTQFTDANGVFSHTNDAGTTVNVVGAPLRFLLPHGDAWEREFLVTGVSGTTITYSPATPAAVPAGTAYVIGDITGYVTTPLMDMGNPLALKKLHRAILEYQPPGILRTLEYGADYDRKGRRLTGGAWTESDREYGADDTVGEVKLGGNLSQGRLGVKALGLPAEECRYAQVIVGWRGIDNPFIIDAVSVELGE